MNDTPLEKIGRYRILGELGRGAMGIVYSAEDPLLSRKVAIKTILMSGDAEERAEYEPRFYQEAKAAGSLNHPNIITIHDIGREGDIAYMAMELLEGVELKSLIMNGRLTLAQSLSIAAQVAQGLAFAHQRGVVHRDIKPSNIMIVEGSHAKIMDFGIARLKISDVKTQTGMLLGSPKYMSPEQIVGRPFDHRSDIFSLGTVSYEMVTGMPPFAGSDLAALMHAVGNLAPHAPSRLNPEVPPVFNLIIAKAMAKNPQDRYQDAREMAADLIACRDALAGAAAAAPSAAGTDPAYEPTQPLPDEIVAPADASPSVPTTPIGAPGFADAGMDATMSSQRYAVSRKFDASATLMRLRAAADGEPAAGAGKRRLANRDHLLLGIAIALAIAAALAIALG